MSAQKALEIFIMNRFLAGQFDPLLSSQTTGVLY